MRVYLLLLLPFSIQAQDPAVTTNTYAPPTGEQRLEWVVNSTVGPASLFGGAVSAGFGTLVDTPHEYGTHWDGFASRFGMREAGVATSNVWRPAWAPL